MFRKLLEITFFSPDFDQMYAEHSKLVANSEKLKDWKLVKLVKTNKLIFDTAKMNNINSVKVFLEAEHEIFDFDIVHISFGLFIFKFANRKDTGIKIEKKLKRFY